MKCTQASVPVSRPAPQACNSRTTCWKIASSSPVSDVLYVYVSLNWRQPSTYIRRSYWFSGLATNSSSDWWCRRRTTSVGQFHVPATRVASTNSAIRERSASLIALSAISFRALAGSMRCHAAATLRLERLDVPVHVLDRPLPRAYTPSSPTRNGTWPTTDRPYAPAARTIAS
jgi:hypothetical protein